MKDVTTLLGKDYEKAFEIIKKSALKSFETIEGYKKEYKAHDRTLRDTQVGNIQKDKIVNENTENQKLVRAVRIPINFPKKIVETASAFEVGRPVTLIPSEENNPLADLVKHIWKVNRLDSLLQKVISVKKSETQSALQFYITDSTENSVLHKILVKTKLKKQAKEIKSKILDNTAGVMTPYFDATGDMKLFMWEYTTVNDDDKTIKNIIIGDKQYCYEYNDTSGKMELSETKLHGFDRIPIVYTSQNEPEWFMVKELIDRYETTLSKLGASNDYSAYPLLQIFGEVKSFPQKDESGKVLSFPITMDPETNKPVHGRAEFLTADNAVASSELEIDKLEALIYSISSTPNLSFDNVKGIPSISGIALKLMFLDPMMKASNNEGDNRTMIERIINVLIGGIITTTNTSLKSSSISLYYDIEFNSILPDDLREAADIMSQLSSSGLVSKRTAVEYLGMNSDVDEELEMLNSDSNNSEK